MPINEINRRETTHTHRYTNTKAYTTQKTKIYVCVCKYRKIRKAVKKEEILSLCLEICNDLFEGIL